jgi:hypothetical protein
MPTMRPSCRMATWRDLDEDSWISIRQRIGDQLDTGSFRFAFVRVALLRFDAREQVWRAIDVVVFER